MKPRDDREFARLPQDVMLAIDRLCNRLEQAWRSGKPMRVETLLRELDTKHRFAGLAELLPLEIEYRTRAGKALTIDELTKRFPTVQKEWLQKQLTAAPEVTALGAVPASAAKELPEVLGDYRILSRLGGGGMGAVYRAVHERMGRQVALKVLKPEIQNNAALQQRFDREVRAAAKLSHPNIVTALDARSHDGVHFLVTELVEGSDLDHHVRQHGPLSVPQAVDVMLQAARGLSYAHSQGVIHRDIKPANLLMSRDGVVKILDMGLARLESDGNGRIETELTDTGVVMGTAAYMPPEQARDTRRADARSDIYSLGCTLHFLLTGRPVYAGVSQVDTILSHVNKPVPSLRQILPQVPVTLDQLFQSMIAKDPADRVQTAGEVAERLTSLREQGLDGSDSAELRELIAQMSTANPGRKTAPAPTELHFSEAIATRVTPKPATKTPRRTAIAGAVGLLSLSALAVWWFFGSGEGGTQQQEEVIIAANDDSKKSSDDASNDQGTTNLPTDNQPNNMPKVNRPSSVGNNPSAGWSFDGRTSYISVPNIIPEPNGSYTIEVIARANGYQTSNLVSWLGPNWMAIYIGDNGQVGIGRQLAAIPDVKSSNQVLSNSEWTHIAATFDGNRMELFINGQPVDQQTVNFELGDTRGGLFLGGVNPTLLPFGQNERFFPGTIHSARITQGIRYRDAFQALRVLTPDSTTIVAISSDASGNPFAQTGDGNSVECSPVNVSPVIR